MKKNSLFKKHLLYIIALFLIGIVTHLAWFNMGTILSSSDWNYWPNEAVQQMYNSWGTWTTFLNFGTPNIQLSFNFFTSIWSIFANLGLSFDVATKSTFLIPIALLGFVSPYVLANYFTQNKFISFISAIFYASTTHFLIRQTAHLPIALVYALAPLVIYLFFRALNNEKLSAWIHFCIFYSICCFYELRITYIISIILVAIMTVFHLPTIKRNIKNILLSICCVVGLNFFWLLPFVLKRSLSALSSLTSRGLFGNDLFDLLNAFTLSESAWTGGILNSQFIKQPIAWYLWLLPLLLFTISTCVSNKKIQKSKLFFLFLALLGIFLTKQVARPFDTVYLWLYDNFPGFNVFREASKLYLITALGYLGVLSLGLHSLRKHKNFILSKYSFYFCVSVILVIASLNFMPLVNGKIQTMFESKQIPTDYRKLKNLISNKTDYFRFFYTPRASRWGIFSINTPKLSNSSVINNEWKAFFDMPEATNLVKENEIISIYKQSFSDQLFIISSIKYIIVPLQDIANNDDFYFFYGGDNNKDIRNWYISELDKIDWLKKINIGTQELVVYENENYKPHIYTDAGLEYVQADMTEFSDLGNNTKLYLNSQLKPDASLIDSLDNIIVPVTYDQVEIDNRKKDLTECEIKLCVDSIHNKIDEYQRGGYFQDYQLQIPFGDEYSVYFKDDVAMNSNDIKVLVNDIEIKQEQITNAKSKNDYTYFGKINLDKSEYNLKLFHKNKQLDFFSPDSLVFVAENNKPDITLPPLEYKQINPTKYVINVLNAKESFPLVFSESYHPDWSLYAKPELALKGEGKFISENNQGTIQNENIDGGNFYDIFFRKDVLSENHFQANNFQNGWWIDLQNLEKQNKITKNADGTYSFQLIIEFSPQKYFYIGLFISGLTLLGCLGYLGYDFYRTRKEKQIAPKE